MPEIRSSLTADQWREIISQNPLPLQVISDSMYPTLQIGDTVWVEPLNEAPQPGDLIVFIQPTQTAELMVHRLVKGELTRGDNRLFCDRFSAPERWVGTCQQLIRSGVQQPIAPAPRGLASVFRRLKNTFILYLKNN